MISILNDLIANNRTNQVSGTEEADRITILSQILATGSKGENLIDTHTGDDTLYVATAITSRDQGRNTITFGEGDNTLIVGQNLIADNGQNTLQFNTVEGNESLLVLQELLGSNAGRNEINLNSGHHIVSLQKINATGGSNQISSQGSLELTVDGDWLSSDYGGNVLSSSGESFQVEIAGDLNAADGNNSFDLFGKGEFLVTGTMLSTGGGNSLFIYSHDKDTAVIIEGGIYNEGGNNHIYAPAGDITIGADVVAVAGSNAIQMVVMSGANHLSIWGSVIAEDNGNNSLGLVNEQNTAWIEGGMSAYSGGSNSLILGGGSSEVVINGSSGYALMSDAGSNSISMSSGTLLLSGNIHAENGGGNYITCDDVILTLNGKVSEGALDIHSGNGYEVLSLKAGTVTQFASNYQDWLGGLLASDSGSGLDVIRVDMGRPTSASLSKLTWLDQLADEFNAGGEQPLALELNIDRATGTIGLDDLFSSSRDDIFSGLDMSGSYSNTLEVSGRFSDNGMDGDFLRVLGDSRDKVSLSDDWTLTQSDFTDASGLFYNVYSNATDELLIQSTISVV